MHDEQLRGPLAFILAASNHGPLIVNRLDFHAGSDGQAYGVGGQVLQTGAYQASEIKLAMDILRFRRKYHGDGVIALDCGANIGIHTVEWARLMTGWGCVTAIEAQERIYYALAGNVALNNCFNAKAIHAAVSSQSGVLDIPSLDYLTPSSFGSLELRQHFDNEYIGQDVDYTRTVPVRELSIDSLGLARLDFVKLDIQRMELEALDGAQHTIARCRPVLLIEKTDVGMPALRTWFTGKGYVVIDADVENALAVHMDDQVLSHVKR